jgi:hypothetical protein
MALPGLNYVVLDANQLVAGDGATVARLIAQYRSTGQLIVLAWVHAFEQSKGSADWWDKAHAHLSTEPDALIYAMPSDYLITLEREATAPPYAINMIEDRANTAILRTLIANPGPTKDISVMRCENRSPLPRDPQAGMDRASRRWRPHRWRERQVAAPRAPERRQGAPLRRARGLVPGR